MIEDNNRKRFEEDELRDSIEDEHSLGEKASGEYKSMGIGMDHDTAMKEAKDLPVSAPDNKSQNICRDDEDSETSSARIERLGRERPTKFKSLWAEFAFCYSIIASQCLAVCFQDFEPTSSQQLSHSRNTLSPDST